MNKTILPSSIFITIIISVWLGAHVLVVHAQLYPQSESSTSTCILPATVLHLQPHQTNYTSLSCFIGFLSTINIDYDFEGATNMSVFFLTGDELEDYRSKITLDVNYFPLQTVFSITGVALDKHLKGFHRVFAFDRWGNIYVVIRNDGLQKAQITASVNVQEFVGIPYMIAAAGGVLLLLACCSLFCCLCLCMSRKKKKYVSI